MKKIIFPLLVVHFSFVSKAQLLTVKDFRSCLYPTFEVQNAVLKGKGFLWIRTDVNTSEQGQPAITTIWKNDSDLYDETERVTTIKTNIEGSVKSIKDFVMVKYTLPNTVYATNFRNRMVEEGYHCASSAFEGDPNTQSWLSNNAQILLRANSDGTFTFITW